jgi:hypothetical protein
MTYTNLRTAPAMIAARREFTGNSLTGTARANGTGRLPSEWAAQFYADAPSYVVCLSACRGKARCPSDRAAPAAHAAWFRAMCIEVLAS